MIYFLVGLKNIYKGNLYHLFWTVNFKNYETDSICESKFDGVDENIKKIGVVYIAGIN